MPAIEIDRTGEVVAGRYQITGLVGRGGMGAVYRARQETLRREIALKVIRKDMAAHPVLIERFRREAEIVAQLGHPNIVTVHDFGETEKGELYIAMELLEGLTLSKHVRQVGALRWPETLPVVRGIAAALAKAHARGVIHRDLKPDNVMLVGDGTGSVVKVLDFGVARIGELPPGGTGSGVWNDSAVQDSAPLTSAGVIVGSPGYLAPEALLGGAPVDARADLYALGLVWLEMLRGSPVVPPSNPAAMLLQNAQVGATPLEALAVNLELPGPLHQLLATLLQPNPLGRPADGGVLLRLLDEAVATLRASASGSMNGAGTLGYSSLDSQLGSSLGGNLGSSLGGSLGPTVATSTGGAGPGSGLIQPTSSGTLPYTSLASLPSYPNGSAPALVSLPGSLPPSAPTQGTTGAGNAKTGTTTAGAAGEQQPTRRWPMAAGVVLAAVLGAGGAALALQARAPAGEVTTPTSTDGTGLGTATGTTAALTIPLPPGGVESPPGGQPPPVVVVKKVADPGVPPSGGVQASPAAGDGDVQAAADDVDDDDDVELAARPTKTANGKPKKPKPRAPKKRSVVAKAEPAPPPEPTGPTPLTSDDIRGAIRKNTGSANKCRNTNIVSESGYGLLVDHCPSYKTPDGQHRIEIDVDKSGKVSRAVFLTPAGEAPIGACVLETLKSQWSFPESTEGAEKIRMPVRFQKCVPIGGKCIFKG